MCSELDWWRLMKRAEQLCHYRNGSVPVGQGKACFDGDQQRHVIIFSNEIYSIDSMHCDHLLEVAKMNYDSKHERWELYINNADSNALSEPEWLPHPIHFAHQDAMFLLAVVEKDAEECIWG